MLGQYRVFRVLTEANKNEQGYFQVSKSGAQLLLPVRVRVYDMSHGDYDIKLVNA